MLLHYSIFGDTDRMWMQRRARGVSWCKLWSYSDEGHQHNERFSQPCVMCVMMSCRLHHVSLICNRLALKYQWIFVVQGWDEFNIWNCKASGHLNLKIEPSSICSRLHQTTATWILYKHAWGQNPTITLHERLHAMANWSLLFFWSQLFHKRAQLYW